MITGVEKTADSAPSESSRSPRPSRRQDLGPVLQRLNPSETLEPCIDGQCSLYGAFESLQGQDQGEPVYFYFGVEIKNRMKTAPAHNSIFLVSGDALGALVFIAALFKVGKSMPWSFLLIDRQAFEDWKMPKSGENSVPPPAEAWIVTDAQDFCTEHCDRNPQTNQEQLIANTAAALLAHVEAVSAHLGPHKTDAKYAWIFNSASSVGPPLLAVVATAPISSVDSIISDAESEDSVTREKKTLRAISKLITKTKDHPSSLIIEGARKRGKNKNDDSGVGSDDQPPQKQNTSKKSGNKKTPVPPKVPAETDDTVVPPRLPAKLGNRDLKTPNKKGGKVSEADSKTKGTNVSFESEHTKNAVNGKSPALQTPSTSESAKTPSLEGTVSSFKDGANFAFAILNKGQDLYERQAKTSLVGDQQRHKQALEYAACGLEPKASPNLPDSSTSISQTSFSSLTGDQAADSKHSRVDQAWALLNTAITNNNTDLRDLLSEFGVEEGEDLLLLDQDDLLKIGSVLNKIQYKKFCMHMELSID